MPFSPTEPGEPDGKVAKEPAERTETETRINEIDNTWRQERQVRITAQRILADHLRDLRTEAQRLTEPPSSRFWRDIRLDLSGATLIDFNLEHGAMAEADFGGATFSGDATFGWATFSGRARFAGATFGGNAKIAGANLSNGAEFDKAKFSGDDVWFGQATFATVFFRGVKFGGRTTFADATFGTVNGGGALFGGAAFSGRTWFDRATFYGHASFDEATFGGQTTFEKMTFSGHPRFAPEGWSFYQSHVLAPDNEHVWPPGWCLRPDSRGGYTVVPASGRPDPMARPTFR